MFLSVILQILLPLLASGPEEMQPGAVHSFSPAASLSARGARRCCEDGDSRTSHDSTSLKCPQLPGKKHLQTL